jgi:predicted alpha/beta-fold hydrolase
MKYGQRVIIKILTNEPVDAHEIRTKLSAQFGGQTYALHMIQFLVREIQRSREDFLDEHRSGRPAPDYIDTKIISLLEDAPFEAARSISQVLNVDHATVLHRLYEKL